jgi:undecaprenyl-diphosphatase
MPPVTSSVLGGIDERIWTFFVDHPFLTSTARRLTDLGAMRTLIPLAVVTGMLVWWRYRSLALAVVPWIALQFNSSLVAVLKRTFDIARPPKELWLGGAAGGSFPSGHVANTACLVVSVAMIVYLNESSVRVRRSSLMLASAGIVVMAWTRLALNVHWFSDVFAGAFVGIGTAGATVFVASLFKSRREIPLRTRDQ